MIRCPFSRLMKELNHIYICMMNLFFWQHIDFLLSSSCMMIKNKPLEVCFLFKKIPSNFLTRYIFGLTAILVPKYMTVQFWYSRFQLCDFGPSDIMILQIQSPKFQLCNFGSPDFIIVQFGLSVISIVTIRSLVTMSFLTPITQ